MKEQRVNGFQILSDGRSVWVNSPVSGASVARFGTFAGIGMIDIHHEPGEQRTKGECLDCRHGPITLEFWRRFQHSLSQHYNVDVGDEHRPFRIEG